MFVCMCVFICAFSLSWLSDVNVEGDLLHFSVCFADKRGAVRGKIHGKGGRSVVMKTEEKLTVCDELTTKEGDR